MKQALFIIILIGIVGSMVFNKLSPAAAASNNINADAATAEQILQATVQIAMYEYAVEPGGSEAGGDGLGTVVDYGGERLIVTHDHWSHINQNLNVVEFRDAMGQLLAMLNAQAFQALILYQDGGTMVLRVPAGLERIGAATVGTAVSNGDVVWVARRDVEMGRQTVEVIPAAVSAVEMGDGPAKMRLENLADGAVIPGDSGGGVWKDGRLVANNWASGMVDKGGLLSELFGIEEVEPTGLIIAALQPFGTRIGVGTAAVESDSSVSAGFEDDMSVKVNRLEGTLVIE